jgi:hypothetical protein
MAPIRGSKPPPSTSVGGTPSAPSGAKKRHKDEETFLKSLLGSSAASGKQGQQRGADGYRPLLQNKQRKRAAKDVALYMQRRWLGPMDLLGEHEDIPLPRIQQEPYTIPKVVLLPIVSYLYNHI